MASVKTGSGPISMAYKVTKPKKISNKSDIVVLHGTVCRKELFDNVAQEIADKTGRKIYAVDFRNHGESAFTKEFSLDLLLKDLELFLSERGIKKPVLLGHSLGGRLAITYATLQPDNVDLLIAEDISPKAVSEETMKVIEVYEKNIYESLKDIPPNVDLETARKIYAASLAKAIPADILQNFPGIKDNLSLFSEELIQQNGKITHKTNVDVIFKNLDKLHLDEDITGTFNRPSLFVYGKVSEFKIADDKEFTLKYFPKAKFEAVEKASHNVHVDNPEGFVEKTVEFLNSN